MDKYIDKSLKSFKRTEINRQKEKKFPKLLINYKSFFFSSTVLRKKILKLKYIFFLVLIYILYLVYTIKSKLESSYEEIEKFIKMNLIGDLRHSATEFYHRDNPQISIIISTFNGEVYLKPAVRSIQNQNFLNIEIIIVDDGSTDKSIEVVKELMKEDKRIKLLVNGVNRGTLYTKTRGVLNSKGKYVMTLDHDNLYSHKNVFNKLYRDAEYYNLDLLGFGSICSTVKVKNITDNNIINYIRTKNIKKPNIKKRFFGYDKTIESSTLLSLYFIKTKLFIDSIKKLGDNFIQRNIDAHDDSILMFIISRTALRLKHLKEIYYIYLSWPKEYDKSLKIQREIKHRERKIKNCYSYLTFIEVLILFAENDDKFIPERWLEMLFFNQPFCKDNPNISVDILRILKLFLNDK